MIKEGSCLQDLKLLAKSELQSKGTAFNFADVELDHSKLIDMTRLILQCLAPQSLAIFWYQPCDYEVVKAIIRTSGFTVDMEPSIWVKGDAKSKEVVYHSAYQPFLIAYNEKRPWWHRETRRGNVFYYPTKRERSVYLMYDVLSTLCRPTSGARVLVPNAINASTVLAAKLLGHEYMAWGSSAAKMEVEVEWKKEKERQTRAAVKAG